MTRVLFHSSDPSRRPHAVSLEGAAGWVAAAFAVAAGTAAALGLFGAPDLIADLSQQADRLALRETRLRSREALESVARRQERLDQRLLAGEIFLARVAVITSVPLPDGFPPARATARPTSASELEIAISAVARRLRALELFRRTLAGAPPVDAASLPSLSPVEPSTAVPAAVFGRRISPLTHRAEFFPGLVLAVPKGVPVRAPAAGTVAFAGSAPGNTGGEWRGLGTMVVLAHDERTRTVYGHLDKALVRRGQKVRRGDQIGLAGASGLTQSPRLHYQVRRLTEGRFLAVDPRLYILDVDWISVDEIRAAAVAPVEDDLPSQLR